jgi:DNA-binding Lrp family transcriptional regulator
MKKKEWVYRLILHLAIEKKEFRTTQIAISKKLSISLSTVNNAIVPLEKIGAIQIKNMGFEIIDIKKIITFWASARNLQKDILYSTRVEMPVVQIEKQLHANVILGAYSAYNARYQDLPADYSEVYVYANEKTLLKIMNRFKLSKGPANLVVLKEDERMKDVSDNNIAPTGQVYCDLWNLKQWYAKDFLKSLEERFGW